MSLIVTNDLKAVLPLEEQLATRRLVKETPSPLTVKIDLEVCIRVVPAAPGPSTALSAPGGGSGPTA